MSEEIEKYTKVLPRLPYEGKLSFDIRVSRAIQVRNFRDPISVPASYVFSNIIQNYLNGEGSIQELYDEMKASNINTTDFARDLHVYMVSINKNINELYNEFQNSINLPDFPQGYDYTDSSGLTVHIRYVISDVEDFIKLLGDMLTEVTLRYRNEFSLTRLISTTTRSGSLRDRNLSEGLESLMRFLYYVQLNVAVPPLHSISMMLYQGLDRLNIDNYIRVDQYEPGKLYISPLSISKTQYSFRPTTADQDSENPIAVFDNSVVSDYVPYIQYNSESDDTKEMEKVKVTTNYSKYQYFKLFEGDSIEERPLYENIIPSSNKVAGYRILYFQVWSENEDVASPKTPTKESMQLGKYTFNEQTLYFSVPFESTESVNDATMQILRRIKNALPTVGIPLESIFDEKGEIIRGSLSAKNLTGNYYIIGLDLVESLFTHMITTIPALSLFLYVEQKGKNQPINQLKIRLRDPLESILGQVTAPLVKAKLTFHKAPEEGEMVSTGYPRGSQIFLAGNTPYTFVEVVGTTDVAIDTFKVIFNLALITYERLLAGKNLLQLIPSIRLLPNNVIQLEQLFPQHLSVLQTPILSTTNGIASIQTIYQTIYQLSQAQNSILISNVTGNFVMNFIDMMFYQGQIKDERTSKSSGNLVTRLKLLKNAVPKLFVKGYSTSCMGKKQPEILSVEEGEKKFNVQTNGPDGPYYDVLKYPVEGPDTRYYACRDDVYKYIGLVRNTTNATINFPFYPCCFEDLQFAQGDTSNFQEYYFGTPGRGFMATSELKDNILRPYRRGKAPYIISEVFNEVGIKLMRYGISDDIDAFLSCVLYAVNWHNYVEVFHNTTNLVETRKNLAALNMEFRKLFSTLSPGIVKQELYDQSEEQICSLFSEDQGPLDSRLHYRILEELLGINIFVFYRSKKSARPSIEIPRFRLLYCRSRAKENLPTVLIYKIIMKDESSHYELLYPCGPGLYPQIRMYDASVSKLMYDLFDKTLITYYLKFPEKFGLGPEIKYAICGISELLANKNVSLEASVTAQYIDPYGKVRVIVLNTTNGDVSVAVPPSQPLNVATVEKIPITNWQVALTIFNGQPNSYTQENNQITGFWFPLLDLANGVYIPIMPIDRDELDLKIEESLETNPIYNLVKLSLYGTSPTSFLDIRRKMRKVLTLILQFSRWLLILGRKDSKFTIADFDKYLIVDPTTNYDYAKIILTLPPEQTINGAIEWGHRVYPDFFSDEGIRIDSAEFKRKLMQRLAKLFVHIVPETKVPTELYGFYQDADDFIYQENTLVFVGYDQLNDWLQNITNQNIAAPGLIDRLELKFSAKRDPYLFRNTDGNVYLIQNVIEGNKMNALYIADEWRKNKVNLGRDAISTLSEGELESLPYVVYRIDSYGKIRIRETNIKNSDVRDYLILLDYANETIQMTHEYAAMLPIYRLQ